MELVEKRILSKEETDQLLKKCKQGDSLAREKLVKHNLKLVLLIVYKFTVDERLVDEYFSDGVLGLVKAIDNFDEARIGTLAFSTYATTCIRNEILMDIRHKKATQQDISLDEVVTSSNNEDFSLENLLSSNEVSPIDAMTKYEYFKAVYQMLEYLSPREQYIIKQKFGLSSWDEIKDGNPYLPCFGTQHKRRTNEDLAKELGCSSSLVSNILNNGLNKLNILLQGGVSAKILKRQLLSKREQDKTI